MPTALFSFKIDKDAKVTVAHIFFGKTDEEAEKVLKAHAEVCPKYGPAYRAKETVEIPVEVDTLPEGDEEAIDDWMDDELLGEEVEEDEEEEDEKDGG